MSIQEDDVNKERIVDQLLNRVVDRVDVHYVEALCKEFISIPSPNPPGDVVAMAERFEQELRRLGINDIQIVEPEKGRRNVIGTFGNGNGPTISLYAHLDVVPIREEEQGQWETPPLEPAVKDGRIYGRGAADTKGGLASMLGAAKALLEEGIDLPGKVVLIGAADGEVGDLLGIKYLEEKGYLQPGSVIACEPSALQVIRVFKGRVWFQVDVKGKAVHASVPQEGINAINKMIKVVDVISNAKLRHEPHPLLGKSTLTFSTINGGTVPNAVAGHCKATFDVRVVPSQTVEGIRMELQAALDELQRQDPELEVSLSILPGAGRESVETPEDSTIVRAVTEAYRYVMGEEPVFGAGIESPGALFHFARIGAQGVFFGPGAIRQAHLANEYVELSRLHAAPKLYAATILNVLAS